MKGTQQLNFSPDLTRLFAAAVVSPDFCRSLLDDAASALADGYCGETFALPPGEDALVLSIEASTLTDFAAQLVDKSVSSELFRETRPAASAPSRTAMRGISGVFHGI